MTPQELKALSTSEAIKKAAAFAGVQPEILDNIWAAETRRGTHPTMISPHNKGVGTAKGHFQQLDSTHGTWEKRTGHKLDRMDFNDALFIAAHQMKENITATKGNVADAVAMYHGGPNRAGWGPVNRKYVADVTGGAISQHNPPAPAARGTSEGVGFARTSGPVKMQTGLDFDALRDVRGADVERMNVEALPRPVAAPILPVVQVAPADSNGPAMVALRAGEAQMQTAQAKADNQSFFGINDRGTTLGATYNKTMQFGFEAVRSLSGDLDRTPDPAWKGKMSADWDKYMAGLNEDQQDDVIKTRSEDEFNDLMFRIAERREDEVVMGRAGTGANLAAGVLAGAADPMSWVIGAGIAGGLAKAGLGSAALVAGGRGAAAALSVVGENIAGNVVYEGVQELMGDHRGLADYGMAAVGALIPGTIFGGLAYRNAVGEMQNTLARQVIKDRMDMATTAIKNVGENAEPAVKLAEMKRLENEQYAKQDTAARAGPPARDRIEAPNLDEAVDAPEPDMAPSRRPIGEARSDGAATTQVVPEATTAYSGGDSTWKKIEADNRANPDELLRFGAGGVDEMLALPTGTHLRGDLGKDLAFGAIKDSLEKLRLQIAPELRLVLTDVPLWKQPNGTFARADGMHYPVAKNTSLIAVGKGGEAARTLVHEFGHALEAHYMHTMPDNIRNGVYGLFKDFAKVYDKPGALKKALLMRGGVTRAEGAPFDGPLSLRQEQLELGGPGQAAYMGNFGELMAEQMVKYVESGATGVGGGADLKLTPMLKTMAMDLIRKFLDLFNLAKRENLLRADVRFEAFIGALRDGATANNSKLAIAPALKPAAAEMSVTVPRKAKALSPADEALAVKHGLDLMPQNTPREQAEFRVVLDMYKKAEVWAEANPRNDDMVNVLGNNKMLNIALPSTLLASSDNPLSRMIAGTLTEQSTNSLGRRNTASIRKYMLEQEFVGNALIEFDKYFTGWSAQRGGGWIEATFKGDLANKFNREVATEIEMRRENGRLSDDPMVSKAADSVQGAYERMLVSQVEARTVGWARLPKSSKGYMPHRVAAARLRDAPDSEIRVFRTVLEGQFEGLNGWDAEFSKEMAAKYLDHARVRASGGHDVPANVHDPAAAEMVEAALKATGMAKEAVEAQMGRYAAGGAGHTKKRAVLNLTTEYTKPDGSVFRLMDMFDVDHVSALRNQSRRVSGEVALADHGIMGNQGLHLVRRALSFGNTKLETNQLQAFDQVAAEMLGTPFGEKGSNQWLNRAITATSLAKLNGMGITQLGEYIPGIWSVGVGHTLSAIKAIPRLFAEVSALSKGERVNNGLLSSMELPGGGGEFGMEGYKMVTPFDSPEAVYGTYGQEAATWIDKALRKGSHLMGTLSMHRRIQAIQVRGMAEQITLKALRFIRDGGESKALNDMGFTPDMVERLKADLPSMVVYDSAGRVKEFNPMLAKDPEAARAFIQSVHRGTRQIIQGSFVGEQSKFVHSDLGRLFTQFRTFSLVAVEKQWARNRGMHGVMGTLGILGGSMMAVLPIYLARTALTSIGRDDREEYLEKRLSPLAIARGTLNYVGYAGFAGDVVDGLTGMTGTGDVVGGRSSGGTDIVSAVVPAAGLLKDAALAVADPLDPTKWAKVLPYGNLPYLVPAINAMKPDD